MKHKDMHSEMLETLFELQCKCGFSSPVRVKYHHPKQSHMYMVLFLKNSGSPRRCVTSVGFSSPLPSIFRSVQQNTKNIGYKNVTDAMGSERAELGGEMCERERGSTQRAGGRSARWHTSRPSSTTERHNCSNAVISA